MLTLRLAFQISPPFGIDILVAFISLYYKRENSPTQLGISLF
jgi:hypothetical protein